MKNIFVLVSFSLLLFSCGENEGSAVPAGTDPDTNSPAGINIAKFETTDLPDGFQKVVKRDANGKILEEGVLKNGKRNGMWIVYNVKKPFPKMVTNFIDDQYSGSHIEYSNTGQFELICAYKANQLDGHYAKFKNVHVIEEGNYKDGQLDGAYKLFYQSKDILRQQVNYKNGQLDGETTYYNEEGQVIMRYIYKDGEQVSGGRVEPEQKGHATQ